MENNTINIFLDSVCKNIKCTQIKENIRQELYEHILEEKNQNIENGIGNEKAEEMAIKKMGNPEKISKEFNKIYKRKIDWKLLIIWLILILTNCLLIITVASNINNNIKYIMKNIAYIVLGIIVASICYFIDYKKIQKFSLRYRNIWNYMYINSNSFT